MADRAKLSLTSLNRIDRDGANPRLSSLLAIEQTLEAAGVRFINERDGTIGVTPRPRRRTARGVGRVLSTFCSPRGEAGAGA